MSCSIQCTNTYAGTGVYMIGRAYICVCVCRCSYVGVFLMDNVCLSLHSPATVHSLPARDRRLSGRTHGYPQFKTQSQSLFQSLSQCWPWCWLSAGAGAVAAVLVEPKCMQDSICFRRVTDLHM